MLVKHGELSGPRPKELMDAIAKLSEAAVNAKTMVMGGGLAPMALTTRVRLSAGKVSALDGPFSESKEVVGGFAIMELPSRQAAIDGALEFMELHRKLWPGWEGETEVRQIFGPEDLPPGNSGA
ncbi:MAG: YciI family protein [Candidatus Acidiferrum sp.]